MRKILAIMSILAVMLLVGCQQKTVGDGTIRVENENGTLEVKAVNEESWCMTGSEWKYASEGSSAQWTVTGIEASGKYAGYCHVNYKIDGGDVTGTIDIYFNEEGSGYQVSTLNGQTSEVEWTAEA